MLKPRREILQRPGEANQARQALWAEGRHVYAGLSGRHNTKTLVTPGHGMYSVKGKNEMLPISGLGCSSKETDGGLGGKTGKTNENVKFIDLLSVVRYHFRNKMIALCFYSYSQSAKVSNKSPGKDCGS